MTILKTILKIIMSIVAAPFLIVGVILMAISSFLLLIGGVEANDDEH